MGVKDWFKGKAGDYVKRGIINPIWGRKGRKAGFPTHDILTTTETPTERDLKRLRLDQLFVSRIKTLKLIESRWDEFSSGWEEMISEYGRISFMKHENLEDEFSMVKSGARHIDKRLAKILEGKNKRDNKALLDELNKSLEKEDQRLGAGSVDAVKLRIDLPGKPAIEEKYLVPPTVPVRYYASWINDKDDLLSNYELAFFGWEANSTWKKHYDKIVKKIFDDVRGGIKQNKDEAENSISILEKVSLQTLGMIMDHIGTQEKKYYDYRTTFVGTVDKISSIKDQIGSRELPNKIMDICFHRTFKIVNPRKIIGQEWYYNPRRFLEKLDWLNKILPENDRVDLMVEGEKIKDLDEIRNLEDVREAIKRIEDKLEEVKKKRVENLKNLLKIYRDLMKPVKASDAYSINKGDIKIRDLKTLISELKKMSDDEFNSHVSGKKNKFADWIRDSIKNTKLAENVGNLRTKEEIIEAIYRTIKEAKDDYMEFNKVMKEEIEWYKKKLQEYEEKNTKLMSQKKAYDIFMSKYRDLEMQLSKRNGAIINAANKMDGVLDGFRKILYQIKKKLGGQFPFVTALDISGWNSYEKRLLGEGELIPGMDENGWPLEVIDAGEDYVFLGKSLRGWGLTISHDYGYVLMDLFDYALGKRSMGEIRKVKKEHIADMDELLWATCIHNEFDAVRDDLRDGRYHPDSLTVVDYIMARKKIGPEKWRVPEIRQEWVPIGERALMNDNKAKKFRENVEMIKANGSSIRIRKAREPSDLIPAFDLRFLKIIGSELGKTKEEAFKFRHLGRKYYYDPAASISDAWDDIKTLGDRGVPEGIIKEFNKYIGPCITSRGISMYLTETIALSLADFQKARDKLKDWSTGIYYDIGPRAFNKDGPTDPFDLSKSVEDGEAEINEMVAKAAKLEQTAQDTDVFDIL